MGSRRVRHFLFSFPRPRREKQGPEALRAKTHGNKDSGALEAKQLQNPGKISARRGRKVCVHSPRLCVTPNCTRDRGRGQSVPCMSSRGRRCSAHQTRPTTLCPHPQLLHPPVGLRGLQGTRPSKRKPDRSVLVFLIQSHLNMELRVRASLPTSPKKGNRENKGNCRQEVELTRGARGVI